jgi:internalin A
MKKVIRTLVPILLIVAIIVSCCWYLFSYDKAFTRDVLVGVARFCENQGYKSAATWFYDIAYTHTGDNDSIAIELAQQYKKSGNYTKAEFTLRNAIQDGGSVDLYIALCKTFVEQDKLLDAVNMLSNITDPTIKQQIEQLRPAAPTGSHASGRYNQYITVEFHSPSGTLYVSADGEYPSTQADKYQQPISLSEGENNMYAVCVADNGLVSPLAVYSYTIGGIIRPVSFADPAIEALVREMLLVDETTLLHTNDLWKIKEFTVPAGAKDYSDIALMTYLEKLTAEKAVSNQLTHISGLTELTELTVTECNVSTEALQAFAMLPKLKALTLSNCSIASIAPLSQAINLEYLDLSNNAIRNLAPIRSVLGLKELILSHNAVDDLSPLSQLKTLTKLDLSYNALDNLDGIMSLTTLSWLNADHNAITQIDSIGTLSSLTYLSLNTNALTDISSVAGCAELTELHVEENKLTEIGALKQLEKLMYLNFSNNKVTAIPAWSKNCALVTIDGSNNKIKSLSPLNGLKSLNKVHMDYNKDISSVKDLADCPLLVEVNVYGTKVKDVSDLTKQSIIVNYNPV